MSDTSDPASIYVNSEHGSIHEDRDHYLSGSGPEPPEPLPNIPEVKIAGRPKPRTTQVDIVFTCAIYVDEDMESHYYGIPTEILVHLQKLTWDACRSQCQTRACDPGKVADYMSKWTDPMMSPHACLHVVVWDHGVWYFWVTST
eukprot:NODE_798_length_1343_cov_5.512365_g584_i0.p1 GENE.NODE_798_length_1343_cov_5.512365_g584_i0~~NODE_798_length_1343_cov_5.512365_g584_i0.p1  ORF type:complete len:144 (-),score=0.32 NODE_798_length_1343_cov_5.512365_g584_i0:580-1011(-)